MPIEHVDFIVHFADGYVRLARLAADVVARDTCVDVRGLLSREEIRCFLDQMLGTGDRCALYVVAALTSVGWTDDKEGEGKAIAKHFGLDWNRVRASIDDFDRRFAIVPRGGRYRYISPTPLGTHLAVEAWTTYPDLMKSLPKVLPSEDAIDAYYERMKAIASNPQARSFAREELAFFFGIDDFLDSRSVRRWSALSAADTGEAARNILGALSGSTIEDRQRIVGRARREMVWTLVRLAWGSSSFHDAVKALALLAEAENETWANNASAEFVARFQIFLGGTAVHYLDRLLVLDELLDEGHPLPASLIIKALSRVGMQHATRTESGPASDELPEREWEPNSFEEHVKCVETAINKLRDLVKLRINEIQSDFINAARELSMLLGEPAVMEVTASFFDTVRETYPGAREPLRKIISGAVRRESKFRKQLSPVELEKLEELHARFEDASLDSRLQQYVGQVPWDVEAPPDLKLLAEELIATPDVLKGQWSWLTSGEAAESWRLGEALAAADLKGELAQALPLMPGGGRDLRLLSGYVSARRQIQGHEWYDKWVKTQFERDPKPIPLLFEVAWRCGATDSVAKMLVSILRNEQVSSQIVGQLLFGAWGSNLAPYVLETVLRAMADTGHRNTAIGILAHRLKSNYAESELWKPLALELVTASDLIRSAQMVSYYWKEVADTLVPNHPVEIAAAIFREQADRESGTWFIEHSDAKGVLLKCVEQDPSGVWVVLKPYLSSPLDSLRFGIGFPRDLLERMPPDVVTAWIAEDPGERAATVAKLASKDFSSDETLASRMIGAYGNNEEVASQFFSEYLSGSFWGPASAHWVELAESLEAVARRTALPKLRSWASNSAKSLRKMAEQHQQREEERDLRGR
jgi:hypothetical protein